MGWLAIVAAGLSELSYYPFAAMYAATVCAALTTSGLVLAWLWRWAMNKEAREKQFGLGSLLFFTTLAALYFAGIRWVVVHVEARAGGPLPVVAVIGVAVLCTLVVIIAYPAVFCVTESLLWFAVWLVRWPPLRPVLKFCLQQRR